MTTLRPSSRATRISSLWPIRPAAPRSTSRPRQPRSETTGCKRLHHRAAPRLVTRGTLWPLQDVHSLRICSVSINPPLIALINLQYPHNFNTSARLSRNIRHPHRNRVNPVRCTILVVTISCKGQGTPRSSRLTIDRSIPIDSYLSIHLSLPLSIYISRARRMDESDRLIAPRSALRPRVR